VEGEALGLCLSGLAHEMGSREVKACLLPLSASASKAVRPCSSVQRVKKVNLKEWILGVSLSVK